MKDASQDSSSNYDGWDEVEVLDSANAYDFMQKTALICLETMIWSDPLLFFIYHPKIVSDVTQCNYLYTFNSQIEIKRR